MNKFSSHTIREIAARHPATVRIFEQFGIDYCCGGRRDFHEVCLAKNIDPDELTIQLSDAINDFRPARTVPEMMDVSTLVDYIFSVHHAFTYRELDRLTMLMNKVIDRHGENNRVLISLSEDFFRLRFELIQHMQKEEKVLFPFIKELKEMDDKGLRSRQPPFVTVSNPIHMMVSEHNEVAECFTRMRALTNNFTLPENACTSFAALYHGLESLEIDLHTHIHLENNVLFEKAEKIENRISVQYNNGTSQEEI